MQQTEKANFITNTLLRLYPSISTQLNHTDAFTLLIAVILSAQCTDLQVNKVTQKLFALASTPQQLSQLHISTIEDIIHPCGFFRQKAKYISLTAKIIHEQYNDQIPKNMQLLENLPGVGHKTASVVWTQYFHLPAFPVDTHVQRLANRWEIVQSKNVNIIEKSLKNFFPENKWIDISIRMVQFGRDHCTAKKHNQSQCPICKDITKYI